MLSLEQKYQHKIMNKCNYRNCGKTVKGRKNKIYCNKQCKRNECKYVQRDNKLFKDEQESIKKLIKKFEDSEINPLMMSLYDCIYNKK